MKASLISIRFSLLAILFAACLATVQADIRLPAIFTEHMVLQQGREIPVWGWGEAGEAVTVSLCGKDATTTTGADGKWMTKLPALTAGGPFEMKIVGKNTVTFADVLIGEVWVCSGQSNMEWTVKLSLNPEQEIAAATHPNLRLFTVKKKVIYEPQEDCEGAWAACTPQTVEGFSAVAYFFGRELHKQLNVPVGLINTSWGGTPAEAWTDRQTLESDPDLKPIVDRWDKIMADYPKSKANWDQVQKAWKYDVITAEAAGAEAPKNPAPNAPPGPGYFQSATGLYNGMITPIVPYAIQGAIWYQGESNAGYAYQYRTLFPAMINCWRRAWGQGDFSFYFVQLANYMERKPEPGDSAWAELREAQSLTLNYPCTGMATIIDIGDAKDIHPKNKQDVGYRLALNALAQDYGKQITYSGPIFDYMMIEGGKARISFKHTGRGLTMKGDKLEGFSIAGKDRKFVWAAAVIEGDKVVVSSDAVPNPVAVRYAWADNPAANLYNEANLPASPFRTDDWPGVTRAAK